MHVLSYPNTTGPLTCALFVKYPGHMRPTHHLHYTLTHHTVCLATHNQFYAMIRLLIEASDGDFKYVDWKSI